MKKTKKAEKTKLLSVTTVGPDKKGLLADMTSIYPKFNTEIHDVKLNVLQGLHNMRVIAEIPKDMAPLRSALEEKARSCGLHIDICKVEKKPYLFRFSMQIAFCVLASGFTFAFVENLLYLKVYIPQASAFLVWWRWTICVAMHMGCSLIAGLGLMRIWKNARARCARPRLSLGYPYLLTAIVIHGAYNGLAVLLSAVNYRF